MSLKEEFVESGDHRHYQYKIGTVVATALSGFLAGAITASIMWLLYIIAQKS